MDVRAVSKRLAYVLRHDPASVGVELDEGGWVDIDALLAGLAAHGRPVSRAELDRAVEKNDKQRYAVVDGRIRAVHGHSVRVDLGYAPESPPDVLWHGTAATALDAILADGLQPRSRRLVHLSEDEATATTVGARHGRPVLLRVHAARLAAETGQAFFRSSSGIWLTDAVPADYLELAGGASR